MRRHGDGETDGNGQQQRARRGGRDRVPVGEQRGLGVVTQDRDAAGHGWFVDPTPGQDEEFVGGAGGPLSAAPGGPADGREDLLTAVLHELGHLAGGPDGTSGLMAGVLAPGVRETQALDQVFARGSV